MEIAMWSKIINGLIFTVFFTLLLAGQTAFAAGKIIGQIVWVKGTVKAIHSTQGERTLARQSPLYEGDRVVTGSSGSGQIVFTDSSLLAIRSGTELILDQYNFDKKGKPQDNHFLLNLVKGGFRTITGIIAHARPDSYTVKTPVATIGVRGTDYSIYYSALTGLAAKLNQGKIILTNSSGKVLLGGKEDWRYAQIASPNTVPTASTQSSSTTFDKQPEIIPATAPPPSSGTGTTGGTTSTSSFTTSTDSGGSATMDLAPGPGEPSKSKTQPSICITNSS